MRWLLTKCFYHKLRKKNKGGLGLTIFTIEVNAKARILLQLKENQYLKHFPEQIKIFLQKYVGHIIVKQTRSYCEN